MRFNKPHTNQCTSTLTFLFIHKNDSVKTAFHYPQHHQNEREVSFYQQMHLLDRGKKPSFFYPHWADFFNLCTFFRSILFHFHPHLSNKKNIIMLEKKEEDKKKIERINQKKAHNYWIKILSSFIWASSQPCCNNIIIIAKIMFIYIIVWLTDDVVVSFVIKFGKMMGMKRSRWWLIVRLWQKDRKFILTEMN